VARTGPRCHVMEDFDQIVEGVGVPPIGGQWPQVGHAEPLGEHRVWVDVHAVKIIDADLGQGSVEVAVSQQGGN